MSKGPGTLPSTCNEYKIHESFTFLDKSRAKHVTHVIQIIQIFEESLYIYIYIYLYIDNTVTTNSSLKAEPQTADINNLLPQWQKKGRFVSVWIHDWHLLASVTHLELFK